MSGSILSWVSIDWWREWESVPQGLKPRFRLVICGTAEAVPLSEADRACTRWPTDAMRLHEWGTRSWGTWKQQPIGAFQKVLWLRGDGN
jgi:hypothetical protein